MGLQTINLGTAGTQSGDTVRQGFSKCNGNFTNHENRIVTLESGGGGIGTPIDTKGVAIIKIDVDEAGGILRIETESGKIWGIDGLLLL
ncbi:MAG: hypothetical protein H8E14_02715 [Candidatus Marinimicrobia bacterium]|nr:hypothetical protein [Candidatus Neomarinimicrobiota bacterium]